MKMERVLVVSREDLLAGGSFRGFRSDGLPDFLSRIGAAGTFRDRDAVEDDPSWKQIIPYAVICAGTRVLLLRRKTTQTEARLHRKASIGVGGHVNPTEEIPLEPGIEPRARALRVLEGGLRRELAEEVLLPERAWAEPAGVLNDDETPVGRVHFGVVYRVCIPGHAVPDGSSLIREVDLMDGRLVDRAELAGQSSGMETWSQLLLESVVEWPAGDRETLAPAGLGEAARIPLARDSERAV
ncbi:MAG: hypothetical protein JXP34_22640 [Planctomycetes bacterium]|nr:hypothetical protein [Planctomycetota bacterium]